MIILQTHLAKSGIPKSTSHPHTWILSFRINYYIRNIFLTEKYYFLKSASSLSQLYSLIYVVSTILILRHFHHKVIMFIILLCFCILSITFLCSVYFIVHNWRKKFEIHHLVTIHHTGVFSFFQIVTLNLLRNAHK